MRKKKLKQTALFLVIVIIIGWCVKPETKLSRLPSQPVKSGMYRVEYVVDGDTLAVTANNRKAYVRLLGIDAPELPSNAGMQSKNALEMQLKTHRQVKLETYGNDKYGRVLAYVWLDGKNLSREQVRLGVAKVVPEWDKGNYLDR